MSRQHFQAIAETISDIIVEANADRKTSGIIIHRFAKMCQRTNPNFDSIRFDNAIQDILIKNS